MPDDKSASVEDQRLTHYLLGLLSDEDTERLDEATIVDDDAAARLRVAENDLVDAYVRGTLAGPMRERFEARYLASPLRRENVRFAGRFVGAIDRAAAAGSEAADPSLSASHSQEPLPRHDIRPNHRLRRLSKRPLTLFAAAALLCLACATLLFEWLQPRSAPPLERTGIAAADQPRREPFAPDIAPDGTATPATAPAPQAAESSPSRRDAADAARRPTRTPPPAPMPALLLLPQTRGVDAIATITVPAGAGSARFDLQLEANDHTRYRATLTDPASNAIVWRSGDLTASPSGDTTSVSVVVPARLLKPQHYSFALIGRSAAGEPAIVGSYTFQVGRP